MTKHKIITEKEPVSSDEIAQRRDFQSILKTIKKVPFYQKPIFLASIAAGIVLVAAVTLFFIVKKNTNSSPEIAEFTTELVSPEFEIKTAAITSPLPEVNFAYQVFEASNETQTNWTSERGSSVNIPKNALVDKNGKLVKGKVEIKFREFHDPVDFFLSGIPMTYDSAGIKYVFESAGMVEILAYQNNEPVYLHSGKKATINLISEQKGNRYNLYEYDTSLGNWVIKGMDKVNSLPKTPKQAPIDNSVSPQLAEINKQEQNIEKEIRKLEQKKPEEPRKFDPKKNYIELGLDVKEFPELTMYRDIKFEVGKENKSYNPKDVSAVVWDGAKLTEGETQGSYNLRLKKGKKELSYIVYPALDGEDYVQAQKNFEKKFSEYKVATVRKEEELKRLQKEIAEAQRESEKFMTISNKVQRTIMASGFGIWNCDVPWYSEMPVALQADFKDTEGKSISLKTLYMVELGRNAIISLVGSDKINIKYNPKARLKIWGITSNNKLALVEPKELAALSSAPQSITLKMNIIDKQIESVEEVKKLIKI